MTRNYLLLAKSAIGAKKKKQLKPLCFKIELLSRKKIFFGQLATDFELAGNQEKKSNKFKLCDRKGNNNYFFLS